MTGPKEYSKTIKYSEFENGEYLLTELPVGEYTVTESGTDYDGYTLDPDTETTVKATVEKGKEATAEFTNVYEEMVIEPVYGDPPVQKILEGDKPAKDSTFEFALTAVKYEGQGEVEKLPMPDEESFKAQKKVVKITGEGTEEFGTLEFTVPGTYTYTITEEKGSEEGYTYDETVHTVVYKVTENADGTLECVKTVDGGDPIKGMENDKDNISKFAFTNKYTKPAVSIKVTKVWDDGDNAQETRTESVTIKLLAGGKDAGKELVISATTEWKGEFSGLDKYDADGKEIAYTVEEAEVKGYTAKVTGTVAEGFTVTNTLEAPDTGDHSDIALWTSTMCAALLGIALLAVIKRRKPEKD